MGRGLGIEVFTRCPIHLPFLQKYMIQGLPMVVHPRGGGFGSGHGVDVFKIGLVLTGSCFWARVGVFESRGISTTFKANEERIKKRVIIFRTP